METASNNYAQSIFIDFVVIPDIHCRTFWKDVVDKYLLPVDTPMCTTRIIFLGDYLDGYPHEWEDKKYITEGIDRFEEIIDIKKNHPYQVKLLLGNHDCGYAIDPEICSSRHDYKNATRISKLFSDNRDCFQLMHKEKGILFSHAGVHKNFLEEQGIDTEHFVEIYNNAWLTENDEILETLGICDRYRLFLGDPLGSPVWADVHSFFTHNGPTDEGLGYQVFGHTQIEKPIINDKFACLDAHQGVLISEDGQFLDPFEAKPIDASYM